MTPSGSDRLRSLARSLATAAEAGAKKQPVKLPVIQRADAAGLIDMMHAELDEAIARRDAEIGARMACHKGCNACCASPVLISEGEAVAIAEWLRRPENAATRARFESAYTKWHAKLAELVEQPTAPSERDAWLARVQQRQAMCAFNHEGACSIYPVRPSLCRKTHALDTNAHCTSTETPARCYQHPETEAVYERQRPLRFALHKALRPTSRLELVCSAVHRTLGVDAVPRSAPCPCGSGKKYKRCCGA